MCDAVRLPAWMRSPDDVRVSIVCAGEESSRFFPSRHHPQRPSPGSKTQLQGNRALLLCLRKQAAYIPRLDPPRLLRPNDGRVKCTWRQTHHFFSQYTVNDRFLAVDSQPGTHTRQCLINAGPPSQHWSNIVWTNGGLMSDQRRRCSTGINELETLVFEIQQFKVR